MHTTLTKHQQNFSSNTILLIQKSDNSDKCFYLYQKYYLLTYLFLQLDENLEPAYEKMVDRISRLPIPDDLKRDMTDGVDFCRQFAVIHTIHLWKLLRI